MSQEFVIAAGNSSCHPVTGSSSATTKPKTIAMKKLLT